jgi:hypothetical protein
MRNYQHVVDVDRADRINFELFDMRYCSYIVLDRARRMNCGLEHVRGLIRRRQG